MTVSTQTPPFGSRFVLSLTLLASASAIGCSKAEARDAPPEPAPVEVTTTTVGTVEAPRILRLTGTLRGARETDLAANVSGRVTEVLVERGSSVEKGAVLAKVDVSAAALALAEARVQVTTSKTQEEIHRADCERYEKLKDKGATTDLEYDQITAKCKTAPLNVEAAEARQRIAAKNVGDGLIRAPFSGVIADRYVQQGEYVQSSSKVVSIAQVNELRLEFSVPEARWPDVKLGADVAFRVGAHDAVFRGKVAHVAGAIRETRDVLVEAVVQNDDKKLLPGMFADVSLNVGTRPLPSVPKDSVFEQNGKHNVFVVEGGVLEQRVLLLGEELGGQFPVLRGVTAGQVVVSPHKRELTNGLAVR